MRRPPPGPRAAERAFASATSDRARRRGVASRRPRSAQNAPRTTAPAPPCHMAGVHVHADRVPPRFPVDGVGPGAERNTTSADTSAAPPTENAIAAAAAVSSSFCGVSHGVQSLINLFLLMT